MKIALLNCTVHVQHTTFLLCADAQYYPTPLSLIEGVKSLNSKIDTWPSVPRTPAPNEEGGGGDAAAPMHVANLSPVISPMKGGEK